MTKTATVDLEFKTSLVGYDDLVKKVDTLIEKVNSLSASTGEISAQTSKASTSDSSKETKATSRFTKMLIKFGGAAGAITLFTKMIKTIVQQSQVYASMVQLVFHPFVIMMNFMLLPVLKWLLPHVIEWLQWTVDNKSGLDSFGKSLTVIGDGLSKIGDVSFNPFKSLIETLTSLSNINASGATSFEVFIESLRSFINLDMSVFKSHPLLKSNEWVFSVFEDFFNIILESLSSASRAENIWEGIDAIFGTFFGNLFNSIKEYILNLIDYKFPFIDEVSSFLSSIFTPTSEPGGRLGVDSTNMNPIINTQSSPNSVNNWGLMLWDSNLDNTNVNRFNATETSLLRARIGTL